MVIKSNFVVTERVSDFLVQILREYEWRHVAFIIDEDDLTMGPLEKAIKQSIREEKARDFDITYVTSYFLSANNRTVNHSKHLLEASAEARGTSFDRNKRFDSIKLPERSIWHKTTFKLIYHKPINCTLILNDDQVD